MVGKQRLLLRKEGFANGRTTDQYQSVSFTLNTDEFSKAVGFVVSATGKDCAEVLNRAGLTALIGGRGVKGAVKRTAKADPARIEARLFADKLAIKIVMSRAKAKGERLTRAEISKRARRLINQRKQASAYTRGPGWNNAIVAMGGKGVKVNKRFAQSEARFGSGKKATANKLVARIINTAPVSGKIGLIPLQAALNDTARDMVEYGTKKLQKSFDKVKP